MTVCASCGHESAEEFAFCPRCGTPAAERPQLREQRKVVTVLFCDLTESTSLGETLDPEALRALLARYFERMKAIVERHGGTVEKFIGDAVMAVFGVPVVHEDDALRALRAAVEMRDVLPELGVRGRIGVTTGEVVTGTEERLATGDAVNVAARLEQAAQPGEILIGAETLGLARDAVEVEALEPLALKGKAEAVAAYRLLAMTGGEAIARRLDVPLVGRAREQQLLRGAWERVVSEHSCNLFTLLGTAGIGKSRLAAEFLGSVDGATVLRGRCLPYGEGITYWPVIEVVKQLAREPPEAIQALLDNRPVPSGDIAWAFRKLLEDVAAESPVVCVFDDIHWGEETFLDLVEHVADLSRDAPILMLCMARPDLLDRRPGWAGGKVNATNVLLEPLGADETDSLIESFVHLDPGLRERIRDAAEGNPLFVEEMVAMVRESPGEDVVVPPTIQALLAARLDQLESGERGVLERGSIEGRVFHRGAVQALAPDDTQVPARLTSLVRKELVRPDKAQLAGEDAFRFRHLLIRDAAYDALPKATRADLHERFALWLEEHGADIVELDEIVGYHLEQASRYRRELGTDDPTLTQAARRRLAASGRRAFMRDDYPAAVGLLERALALVAVGEIDIALETDRVNALLLSGRGGDAYAATGDLVERAAAGGDRLVELLARIEREIMAMSIEPEGANDRLEALLEEPAPVVAASGDAFALYLAALARGMIAHNQALMDDAIPAYEEAVAHGRRAGLPHLELWLTRHRGAARFFGSTPVAEVIRWIEEQEAAGVRDVGFHAPAIGMQGRLDEARAIQERIFAELEERGAVIPLAQLSSQTAARLELSAGNAAAAAALAEKGCRLLEEAGERGWLSTGAGNLAQALYALDRLDEADAWAGRAAELGGSDDAITQMLWRQVRAKVLARRGEPGEAERLAREAVAIGGETHLTESIGDAHADLAEVLELAGRAVDARAELEAALALYERKGHVLSANRMRARLDALL